MKDLSVENQSGFLPMFFDSVFKSPYPFAFSLPCYVRSNTLFLQIFKIQINHSLRLSEPFLSSLFRSGENVKIIHYFDFKSVS